MERRGRESRRLVIGGHPGVAQLALFVRDACRLPVADAPGISPPLAVDVADRRDLLEPDERADAAARWVRWWEAIVAHERASELEVLADERVLQRAVRSLHEGSRWSAERARSPRTAGGPGGSPIHHGLVRAVAEEVIERTGVRPGKVRAGVLVRGVEGHCAHRAASGVVVCSEATARDEAGIRPLLEEAFRSGIDVLDVEVRAMTPRRAPRPASVLAGPIAFADGRIAVIEDLAGLDVDGDVILSRFWREGSEDEL